MRHPIALCYHFLICNRAHSRESETEELADAAEEEPSTGTIKNTKRRRYAVLPAYRFLD